MTTAITKQPSQIVDQRNNFSVYSLLSKDLKWKQSGRHIEGRYAPNIQPPSDNPGKFTLLDRTSELLISTTDWNSGDIHRILAGNVFGSNYLPVYGTSLWSDADFAMQQVPSLFQIQQQLWNIENRQKHIEAILSMVQRQLGEIKAHRTFVVPLITLSPEPYILDTQIPVVVEGEDDNFTATFYEANIAASGDTISDAIANFKETLVMQYEFLEKTAKEKLGPLPRRQWEIIQNLLKRMQ
jgi:hypothetical protein